MNSSTCSGARPMNAFAAGEVVPLSLEEAIHENPQWEFRDADSHDRPYRYYFLIVAHPIAYPCCPPRGQKEVLSMSSASLLVWNGDRANRLNGIEAQCAAVPLADAVHLDECLRGFVMHLSAHFQGFCRDLYFKCSQVCSLAVPAGIRLLAQKQFTASLALEKGNPSHENLVRDFSRFGFDLSFTAAHVAEHLANGPRITALGHLQAWRNRAVHQGTSPLGGGVPAALTLPLIRDWR